MCVRVNGGHAQACRFAHDFYGAIEWHKCAETSIQNMAVLLLISIRFCIHIVLTENC